MKHEDTVCYKVDQCIKALEKCVKTSELDIPSMAKTLHDIRLDAQNMEDALKRRKAIMEKAEIEDLYQTAKGNHKPKGVNKITDTPLVHQNPEYEVLVKNGEEVIYHNKVRAGVMCTVDRMDDMDADGVISGETQKFFFGQTVAYWYAFDQLGKTMEDKGLEIAAALREMAKNNQLLDPEIKAKLLRL